MRALGLPLLLLLSACSSRSSGVVLQSRGSDTMVNLAQAWAETFAQEHEDIRVAVSGGGSGTGLAALVQGTVDLANASRRIRPEEVAQAERNTGKTPVEHVVALDALAVFVHRDNPVRGLTFAQLACIFGEGGTCERWSDVGVTVPGCAEGRIVRISRQSNSGTFHYFRETVVGKQRDLRLGSLDLNGSSETIQLVAHTPCAIGYVGMGYLSAAVKAVCVGVDAHGPCVAPTPHTAQRGEYPITRPLLIYTLGEPEGAARTFLEWVDSVSGQAVVRRTGYVSATTPVATREPAP